MPPVSTPLLLAMCLAAPATAEVVGAGPTGFRVRATADVAAPPAAVWATLVDPARWWSGDHTDSGSAANLSLAAEPGGCFCERLDGGGGVEHARVVQVRPGALLRRSGGLGPLQAEGASATLTWELEPSGAGTRVTQTMSVGGWSPEGLDRLARPVDGVLVQALARLERAVER